MNILGPDYLVFGVDDLAGCRQFLLDYGLREQENGFLARWMVPGCCCGSVTIRRCQRRCPAAVSCGKPSMAWRIAPRWR